jgi:tRNA dimethylallyltransferase
LTSPRAACALIICGPTASGKSAIALRVAELLQGEVVNADSRQVYRDMPIGTGTPPAEYFERVAHHLYAFVDPAQRYSAAQFAADAGRAIAEIHGRGKLPVVAGGTGFYIEALTGSMTLNRPAPDEELRSRLRDELQLHGSQVLWEWLAARRPALAERIRPTDAYRVLRGLETTLSHRAKTSGSKPPLKDSPVVIVRLSVPRDQLRDRIRRRVRGMFEAGLVGEAVSVRSAAPASPALSGLGYAEALAYWDGLAIESEAIARVVTRTEQYAKRQETWFRHMHETIAVNAAQPTAAVERIVSLARERFVAA